MLQSTGKGERISVRCQNGDGSFRMRDERSVGLQILTADIRTLFDTLGRRVLWIALTLIILTPQSAAAAARCGQGESDPRCWSNFESFNAFGWASDGFIAVGRLRTKSASAPAIVRISASGSASRPIELAGWGSEAEIASADFHEVLALPNGDLALIGSFHPANWNWLAGLIVVIDASGRVKSPPGIRMDPTANVLFQSGVYDAASNAVIAVGRVTAGPDDGACAKWSRSLLTAYDASTGAVADLKIIGSAAPGLTNRQAIYDIGPTSTPRQYAFIGFQTKPDATGSRCRDTLQIGLLSANAPGPNAARWIASVEEGFDSGENGFAMVPIGNDEFVIAGQVGDPIAGPSLAHAVRIKLKPFAVVRAFDSPRANLAGAQGGARFRTVTPIRDSRRLFFAGSVTPPSGATSVALTQIALADLSKPEPAAFADGGASDILGAASSAKGQVLAGGYALDEKGRKVGWLELFGGGAIGRPAASSDARPMGRKAQPDRSLPPLFKTLERVGSDYKLPDGDLRSISKFYLSTLSEGAPLDLAFAPSEAIVLQARLLVGAGDLDLALFDADGRLVDFSNYRTASQIMITALKPGKYRLSVFAESDAKDIEIDVGRAEAIDVATMASITAALAAGERESLSEKLRLDGLSRPSEPSIAFGGETVRSLFADQSGVGGVSPKVFEKLPRGLGFMAR